jgi:hypothetical protein
VDKAFILSEVGGGWIIEQHRPSSAEFDAEVKVLRTVFTKPSEVKKFIDNFLLNHKEWKADR